MASTPEFLEYVLDLLREVPDITYRKMMGEYVLYASGKVIGGIYDDRFLVKHTPASDAVLHTEELPNRRRGANLVSPIGSASPTVARRRFRR